MLVCQSEVVDPETWVEVETSLEQIALVRQLQQLFVAWSDLGLSIHPSEGRDSVGPHS